MQRPGNYLTLNEYNFFLSYFFFFRTLKKSSKYSLIQSRKLALAAVQWVQPWKSPETTDANRVILYKNRAVLSLLVQYTITHTHSYFINKWLLFGISLPKRIFFRLDGIWVAHESLTLTFLTMYLIRILQDHFCDCVLLRDHSYITLKHL